MQVEAKELLLRDISHELRSPLGRIQIALGLAALEKADIPAQHRRIERDVERMDALIEEIIRLARLTDAPHSVSMEIMDAGELIKNVVDDAISEARARACEIDFSAESSLFVSGNGELLRRAIENVLRNAIRFSPICTTVEVKARRDCEKIVIEIRDRGPGVSEADLERIFEPFFRVSFARERDSGGTGLGLAITERVMSLHSGRVTARNHPAGGLIVTLVCPMASNSKMSSVVLADTVPGLAAPAAGLGAPV
jgi:two-component system sensor histidine kinase CpxA